MANERKESNLGERANINKAKNRECERGFADSLVQSPKVWGLLHLCGDFSSEILHFFLDALTELKTHIFDDL